MRTLFAHGGRRHAVHVTEHQHTRNAAGPAPVRKKLASRGVLGKISPVGVGPGGEKAVGTVGFHQGPNAAPETCRQRPKRRRRPAGGPRRRGKTVSGTWLPSSCSAACCDRSTSRPNARRSPPARASPAAGMISPLSIMKCSSRAASAARSNSAVSAVCSSDWSRSAGIRRAAQRGRQVRIVAAGLPPP